MNPLAAVAYCSVMLAWLIVSDMLRGLMSGLSAVAVALTEDDREPQS